MEKKKLDLLVGGEVYLSEPRQVVRVGYLHDTNTELLLLAAECGFPGKPINLIDTDSRRNQMIEYIFNNHPLTAAYREHTQALHHLPYTPSTNLVNVSRGIVLSISRVRVKERDLPKNPERTIHFAPLPQDYAEFLGKRWKIHATKIVTTGEYSPGRRGWGDDGDDPPSLINQRKHVLYHASPCTELDSLWILERDTLVEYEHQQLERVAKRLMQFP